MTCLGDGNDHLENTVIKFSIEAQSFEDAGKQIDISDDSLPF